MLHLLQKIVLLAESVALVAPTPISWASQRFNLNPTVHIDALYDSNITLSENSPEADFITIINPSIEGSLLLRAGEISLGYTPRFLVPTNNLNRDGLDKIQHNLFVEFLTNVTKRISVEVSDKFESIGADIARPADQIANKLQVNTATIDATYKTPLALGTDAALNLNGSRSDVFDFSSDRWAVGGSLDLTRDITPRLTGGLRNRVSWLLFDSSALQDVIIYGVDGRIAYEIFERLNVTIPAGVQYLIQKDNGSDLVASFDVVFNGQISERSDLTVGYERGFTVDALGETFSRWEASLSYSYEVNRRLDLEVGGRYLVFNSASVSEDDDGVIEGSFDALYDLSVNMKANFGARLFFNRGKLSTNDFDNIQIFIGITYDFLAKN